MLAAVLRTRSAVSAIAPSKLRPALGLVRKPVIWHAAGPSALAFQLARPLPLAPNLTRAFASEKQQSVKLESSSRSRDDNKSKANEQREMTLEEALDATKRGEQVPLSRAAQRAREVNLSARLSRANSKENKREFRRLFALIRNEKRWLALGLVLLLISSAISLSLPAIIGKILDAVNDSSTEKSIFGLPIQQFFMVATGFFVLGWGALYARIVVLRSIGERIVSRLRARVFRRIVGQDSEFFDANRTGDLISRLGTDANVVSKAVTQNIADGLRSLLTAAMGVGMMSFISLKLTAIITLILPPVMVGTWLYGRKVRGIAVRFQAALGNMTRVAEERLNNVRTAQSFGGETQEMHLYNQQIRKVFEIAMQDARATGTYFGTMQFTGNMVVIGILAMGANMVSQGALTFGELSSFIMYTAYAGSAVSGIGNFYSELMKGAGAAARLFEIEDRQPSISPAKGEVLKNPRGDIGFHHVEFAYPTRPALEIFRDLDVVIKAGSHVVIVGQSGGGKSTVMALLMRFYDPTGGYISIGSQNLKKVSPWSIRRNVGIVSQEPVLFNASIADNIKYAKPDATREQVVEAAAQANCTFLVNFPDGIDTMVGPRGTQLSGGQKQRIAIARAIINRPAILVLDEATSALDGESETLVNDALKKLVTSTSTTISIAHRLSTIARAEEVIVLGSGGSVVEAGRFTELYNDPKSELSQLLQRRHELVPREKQWQEEKEEQEFAEARREAEAAALSTEEEYPSERGLGVTPENAPKPREANAELDDGTETHDRKNVRHL